LWVRPGDGQLFVAGYEDQEFTIWVGNSAPYANLLVVPAIDHRAVMEDKSADVSGMGMIIPAKRDYTFDGWRQDSSTTRPFVFTFPEHSVSQQADGPSAVTGVIGLAVYSEAHPVAVASHDFDSPYRGDSPVMYGGSKGVVTRGYSGQSVSSVSRDLGTGIGAREQFSPVSSARFQRGAMSMAKLLYASEESLRAAGLMGPAEPPAFPEPKGFQNYSAV
jgi:uncharacterized repeat protein (TIGR02543 family)